MNENEYTIKLGNYLPDREGWGRQHGTNVRQKLEAHIRDRPAATLVRLSLQSVKRIDVGFASEAIVGLIKDYRDQMQMCLVELTDPDVTENIAAAADRMNVPVTIWNGHLVQIASLSPGSALHDALAFALARPKGVRSADFAAASGISITNASSRFKQLWDRGFLLRSEGLAKSGGAEFVYRPIG